MYKRLFYLHFFRLLLNTCIHNSVILTRALLKVIRSQRLKKDIQYIIRSINFFQSASIDSLGPCQWNLFIFYFQESQFLERVSGPKDSVNHWRTPPKQSQQMVVLDDLEPSKIDHSLKKMSNVSTSTHILQGQMTQTDGFDDPG